MPVNYSNSSNTNNKYAVGELRPSQLLFSFGVGSLIDLPNLSVIVMGLDYWETVYSQKIGEERLLEAVRAELGPQVGSLRMPPAVEESVGTQIPMFDESKRIGVPVAPFPGWLLCPESKCRLLAPINSGFFKLKPDQNRTDRTRFVHENCPSNVNRPTVLPARFLLACTAGHLDDFPWITFVHGGGNCEKSTNPRLHLREFGVSGEAADIQVTCDACESSRRMSDAFGDNASKFLLATCSGRLPHLRTKSIDACQLRPRTILLGASNSWFPIYLTALSIPVATDVLGQVVEEYWPRLSIAAIPEVVKAFLDAGDLPRLTEYSLEKIWEAIQHKKTVANASTTSNNQKEKVKDLKLPEWQLFSRPEKASSSSDFKVASVEPPPLYRQHLEQVVLVERLREVQALTGFTRIESPRDFDDYDELKEHRVPLSRKEPTWVPASEVRGEGLFLRFDEETLTNWLISSQMQHHDSIFRMAHRRWRESHNLPHPDAGYPGLRYVLLHSFSHALMRQLSLECGYSAASIRERIYSLYPEDENGPMAGVLIYTAAPDSEGTLGGLVALGSSDQLGHHIEASLEQMRLCASDPLCSEHISVNGALHGAACHACLFAPETSCERGNKYLDRSVLVPTVDKSNLAYFIPNHQL